MRYELDARIGRGSDIDGHLEFLYQSVRDRGGSRESGRGRRCRVAELGVRAGNSTCAFLAALEITRGSLWSVDIRPSQTPAEWDRLGIWFFLQADDLSPEARAFIPPRIDVLLIDTSHAQGHTLAELETYAPRVRDGGLVLCHDTQWAEGDVDTGTPDGPVARALDQWCVMSGQRWENRPGSFGMGVIKV